MSRGRPSRNGSRVPDSAVAALLLEQLNAVFDTLSERQAGIICQTFGITDGQRRSDSEIGQLYSISPERVKDLRATAMRSLRHPSRTQILRDYMDDLEDLRAILEDRDHRTAIGSPVRCPNHGWTLPIGNVCPKCPCYIEMPLKGRRRLYCSNACRQAAYRDSQRAKKSTLPNV